MTLRLFVLAGEPSGDKLGAALLAGLRELNPDLELHGVGGPLMQAEGLNSLFPMEELSVMGLAEVLPRYPALRRRLHQAARRVSEVKPDALITIDSPDFSLRLAKLARKSNPDLKTIHYVAPSVWAWRAGRAAKMAKVIDHVLALLPFEPPYMEKAGMTCDFVGHPVVAEPLSLPGDTTVFRARYALNDGPVVLALPGSRRGEIKRLLPRFGETLRQVAAQYPNMRVLVPTVPHLADELQASLTDWPGKPLVIDPRNSPANNKLAAFGAASVALAASGTVSLELAAASVPMVIGYDMAPLTRMIMKRMLKLDTVTLVNLVSETRSVPEFLGDNCRPELMAAALTKLLSDPQARFDQVTALELTMERLGRGQEPPGLRAARSVLNALS